MDSDNVKIDEEASVALHKVFFNHARAQAQKVQPEKP